jgi:hypothetical protein
MRFQSFHGDVRKALEACLRQYKKHGAPGVRLYWVPLGRDLHREFDKQWAAQDGGNYSHVPGSRSRLAMVMRLVKEAMHEK